MKKTIRFCDGIGCQKQEEIGNHWFIAGRSRYNTFILTISHGPVEGLEIVTDQRDYCGEECLIRAVSAWATGAANENATTLG